MTGTTQPLTAIRMGQMIGAALEEAGMTQAEFCRRAGISTKHLNRVIQGHDTEHLATLDYWAFVLGLRWDVSLAPRSEP